MTEIQKRAKRGLEKKRFSITSNDGKELGSVSYSAYKAIKNNTVDSYVPQDDEEIRVLASIKSRIEETQKKAKTQRSDARAARMKALDTEIEKVKGSQTRPSATSGNMGYAHRMAGVMTPKEINKTREAQKEKMAEKRKIDAKVGKMEAEKENIREWGEMLEKEYGDNFFGQSAANYTLQNLEVKKYEAIYRYIQNPTEENKKICEEYQAAIADFSMNNQAALDDEGAVLPWLSKKLAGYLPQAINQLKYGIEEAPAYVMTGMGTGIMTGAAAGSPFGGIGAVPGAIAGGLTGTSLGLKAAYTMGAGKSGYVQMAGAAYETLIEAGLSHEEARELAQNEGFVNGLIESGSALLDVITWGGFGKGVDLLKTFAGKTGKKALLKMGIKSATIDKLLSSKAAKGAVALGKMAFDAAGEGAEEGLQAAVSITNRNNTGENALTSPFSLAAETGRNIFGNNFSTEEKTEIKENTIEGAKLGLLLAGGHAGVSASINGLIRKGQNRQAVSELNKIIESVNTQAGEERIKPLGKNATAEEISSRMAEVMVKSEAVAEELQSSAQRGGAVGGFGLSGQKAFDANYIEEQNPQDYAEGFTQFYRRGHIGQSFEQANAELQGTSYVKNLSADQRLAAYSAGVNDAKASLAVEKAAVSKASVYTEGAGVVQNESAKKVNSAVLEQVDRVARALGTQVIFEEDIEGSNGYMEADGKIHISLNAENPVTVVAAHEMTHRMQQLAPESYRIFRNYAMSVNGADADVISSAYQQRGWSITEEELMDEVAARYTEKLIRDPENMKKFIDDALEGKIDTNVTLAENRNLLQRMLDAIRNFINRIKNSKAEKKAAADKGITLSELEQAEKLLKNAFRESARVIRENGDNVHFSEKYAEGAEGKKHSIKIGDKTEVVFERSFAEQVNEVLSEESDITDGNHVFVCKRTSIMKQLGFPDLPTLITKGHLRDMHHPEVEGENKYHGMSEPEINMIPEILDNPAMVFKSISDKNPDAICFLSHKKDGKGRPIQVVIDVNGEGKYNEVKIDANVALSAYGKDGFKGYLKGIEQKNENVMYINQKRTQELLKGEGLQLPARLSKLRFNSIIHRIDDFVNIKAKIDSKTPNQNIEIKYGDSKKSIKMGDAERQNEILKKVNAQLNKSYLELKNGKKSADTRRIARIVREILDDNGFAYDRDRLTEQFEGLTEDALAIKDGRMDFETFREKVKEVARAVVDEGTRSDSAAYQESKAVRDYLRTTAISLGEADRNNLGDEYEIIRKGTFGRLRLVKEGGTPIDVAYRELSELFPEYFSTETEVGASAQLRQIVNVLDGLQSLKTTPFSGYENEASEWLSGMMIDRIFNEIFVSGRTGKVEVSVDMKALRESMGDNLQRIMNRERSWRTREYEKLQKQFEKKTKSYTEARQKAIKIRQVKLHTERLSKALLNPSERFAVPEFLKAPVAKFLSCIDVSSDRMSEKTREMLGDLMKAYKAISEQEYELSAVVDPSLYDKLDEISEEIATLETENKKLTDLSLETLEKLRTAVMAMEASVRNYNKAFREGKAMQIDMLATAAAEEIQQRMKGNKANSKIYGVKQLSDLMNFEMMNPWDYFHQMGGTFEELFMGLRQGENKQIRKLARAKENMTELRKSFGINPQKISGKNAERTTFRLSNGDEVDFTKAQVMSLYLLWRQNASHEHILEGGFRPGKGEERIFKKKDGKVIIETKHYERYTSYRPSLEDVGKIIESLSENEKKFAEGISRFFTEECAEWGNEVALQLYGYKKFATPDYFPIVSDRMSIQEEFGVSVDSTIKNMGCTQKRIKHANNPVIIEDIFDVYARHTSDMAKYNAYVLPLQDIQRVFNYISRGEFEGEESKSVEPISAEDVKVIQGIGRKSVNDFTAEELRKTKKFAEKYFKEMGKKSPFYRAEHGDWRESDNSEVETVLLKDNQEDLRGIVKNRDTSVEISVSKIGIDHIKVHLHNSELSSYITKNLKKIAENAILLDSFVSEPTGKTKHKNSAMLHSFYVPIEFNGKKSVVKLFVEEFFNEWNDSVQRRVYDLKEIEVFNDADRFGEFDSAPLYASKTTSIDTVSDLFRIVKGNDASFRPNRYFGNDYSVQRKSFAALTEGSSIKALIASKYGEKAVEYFSKLMSDINGGIKVDYNSELANGMVSKYKRAKMGANLRVVIQQPVSYLRAAVLIDSKYLAKANGHKVDIEKIFKYSPIAQWKDWGFFSIDTGMSMKSLLTGAESKLNEISEKSMWAASKADQATWKKLWAAVELETADLHPELNRGSEAFYEACGKRFDEIIDRTQVVDSTLHRSQILRSKNDLVKMSVSFMSEPLKTFNLLRTAVVDAALLKTPESKRMLVRTVGVCVVSSIVLACVTGAYDTLRGDDDEKFLDNFTENLIGDWIGMVPYVKDIYSIFRGYDVKRMDMQGIGDVVNAVRMFCSDKYTYGYKIANVVLKLADLCGIPATSFKKSVYDVVIKNVFRGLNNQWLDYGAAKQMYSVNGNQKGEFLNILFEAYSKGNKKYYDRIFSDMIKEGIDAKSIESGLRSRYKTSGIEETFSVPWNNKLEIPKKEAEKKFSLADLTEAGYAKYDSRAVALEGDIVSDVERMKSELGDDAYYKLLDTAYNYIEDTALEYASGGKFDSEASWINQAQEAEEEFGIDPVDFMMFRQYFNDLTPPEGQEKFKTNEKKRIVADYLNDMGLSDEEWNFFYQNVAGYKR